MLSSFRGSFFHCPHPYPPLHLDPTTPPLYHEDITLKSEINMINLKDIHPLTGFLRNHKAHIKRLKSTGRAQVLTINGEAQLIVQDAKSYQALLDRLDHAESVEILRHRVASLQAGEPGIDADKAFRQIESALAKIEKSRS